MNDNTPHWPRGLLRNQAARYIGVGQNHFDTMVNDGRMPKPKRIDNRTIWDKLAVDRAFDLLDGGSIGGETIIEFAA